MYNKLVFLKCNPKTVDFFVKALARQNDGNRFVKFLGVWAVSLNLSSNLKENIFWNCITGACCNYKFNTGKRPVIGKTDISF